MIKSRINISKYGSQKVYGLDFLLNGTVFKRVKGITPNFGKIKEANERINNKGISKYHIDDIIDDILE